MARCIHPKKGPSSYTWLAQTLQTYLVHQRRAIRLKAINIFQMDLAYHDNDYSIAISSEPIKDIPKKLQN